MAQEIKMSAAGLKAMQEELEYLKTVRRKELAEEIKEARSHGDLSENSEYDEAKNTQGLVENRITELEQMVKNAVVIDESELSVDSVVVGTHVTIQMTGDDEKEEYRIVTSYLNDIETLEKIPKEERDKISEIAVNVVQLNKARTEFLNSSKKLSDAQFTQLEQQERELPEAIKRFKTNELHRDTLQRDMKYLEREKSEWNLRKEYLDHQQKKLKNVLYIIVGLAVTLAVVFGILQIILEKDFYYAWMGLIFATAVVVCGIYMKIQNDLSEIQVAERSQNRAIVLLNKVKLKYINVANAVDYACEKYHVKSAGELENQWQYYLEAVKERQKYQRTNEDLEYFNGRLVRMLSNYQLYDAHVWVTQAVALVDPKEMVEIKHGLIGRRQKLRARIENNLSQVNEQKEEAEQLLDKVGSMRPQMEKILNAVDKINEGD